ncbi:hypothetical protein DY000_02024164 [Brassica cretica]|uniref:RRM domain-containing protein n=1 Tax=Brassica cretica TaxID=69181 RepID=A0ABQ7E1V5_BRACR|nr:hypothetical protein DY000_02024164 [Brassica cretica]
MGDLNDPFMRNQNAAVQARTKVQNRSNVLQLKLMGQSHPTGLTPSLLKLFEPRARPWSMALYVSHFAEPGDPEYAPPKPDVETPAQKRARIHKSRLEKGVEKAAEDLKNYDPNNDPNASGDPYKTLFVARLNYETSDSKIKREFEAYGPIKQVCISEHSLTGSVRFFEMAARSHVLFAICLILRLEVYWFLNFYAQLFPLRPERHTNRVMERRLMVEECLLNVERGRTVPNWRPRRLGGGLGTTRVPGEKITGEEEQKQQQPSQGRSSRSEEPRAREDREKSRDRGKEREREQSRERGDRDRRTRDHDRDRSRKREREYESGEYDDDGGRSRERETEYERGGWKQRKVVATTKGVDVQAIMMSVRRNKEVTQTVMISRATVTDMMIVSTSGQSVLSRVSMVLMADATVSRSNKH